MKSSVSDASAGVDVDGRKVQFRQPIGPVSESYDLLVGADGVGSAVRSALQQYYPDMTVVVTDSGRQYKTYRSLRGDIEPEGESGGYCMCPAQCTLWHWRQCWVHCHQHVAMRSMVGSRVNPA